MSSQAVRPYRAENKGYSVGRWRVLDANGAQVLEWASMDHPVLGTTSFIRPVCFDRKRDALAWIEADAAEHERAEPWPLGHEMRGGLRDGHQHMAHVSRPVAGCPACAEWADRYINQAGGTVGG